MENFITIHTFEQADNVRKEINSPRTLEACLRSGYDPAELRSKPRSFFKEAGLTEEMIDIKYNLFERKRQGNQILRNESNL